MNKKILAAAVVATLALLQACNSSDGVRVVDADRPTASRPASSTEVDVFNDFVAAARAVPDNAATATNLLSNPGFENGLDGWTECMPGAIDLSVDANTGSAALELNAGHCFYRSVQVTPGLSYALNCAVKLTTERAWTGMGLSFSNADYQVLSEAPVAVATSADYTRLSTVASAPDGTEFVSLWIHSDHGARVDDCSLTLEQDQQASLFINTPNALVNGDFSDYDDQGNATGWVSGCAGSAVADASGLFLSDGNCVDQALDTGVVQNFASGPTSFSCLITEVEGYADLSLFLDEQLVAVKLIEPDAINSRVTLTVGASHASNGFVTLYTDGHLRVDSCLLNTADGDTQTTASPTTDNTPSANENQPASARYRLTFNATWSAQTHPLNFPPPAHFSPLTGAVHNDQVVIWRPGQLASDGVELMAETGDSSAMLAEIASAVGNGTAAAAIDGDGVATSPGSSSIEFEVTREHPLVSLTTMVAPSPDWFVGIRDLALFDGSEFVDAITIDAVVYDSGTDSGLLFTSDDDDTQPPTAITRLNSAATDTDIQNGVPAMGQFIIEKLP